MITALKILLISFFLSLWASSAFAAHGISIDGKLKYPADFTRFDYTSDKACKGGDLKLHDIGSFDKMNPFTLKGLPPFGLEMLVFEPLAVASLDEPFAEYGLIASDIEIAADKLSMIVTINSKARFSDNSPITGADIQFSLDTMKSDKVHPGYPYYYQDITKVDIIDDMHVRFVFARKNRELPMIAAQIPVLSKKFYTKHPFDGIDGDSKLVSPVGSGPYVVDSFKQGKYIIYKRNLNYWAGDHPTRKGVFNFNTIKVNYYKDQIVAVEAFKAGEYDYMLVNIAKQWARDLDGKKVAEGEILKKIFPHKNNAGMQGFLMNTRREIFQDSRVRQALGLAFDFEWTNKSLFFNQYSRSKSFFSNSYLAATDLPTGLELQYLEPFKESLPPEIFTQPLEPPGITGKYGMRGNLRKAKKLLQAAGWTIRNGILTNSQGKPFTFDILLVSPSFERVIAPYVNNLKKLGIKVDYRTIDPALYVDRIQEFDFDMIVHVYGQSQSPGNEQRNFWHSESADRKGSKNLAGIKNPAVDVMVEKIIYAETSEQLVAACRALDRILWYGYYVIPNWFMDGHRIVWHNIFAMPDTLPVYYNHYQLLFTWWDKDDCKALESIQK